MIAYVNHDIDDAVRAGVLDVGDLPIDPVRILGATSSERIGTLVTDVVTETLASGGVLELRMRDETLRALLALRAFLFEAVYENRVATAEFEKAAGILGGLWERVRRTPGEYLDARTQADEGLAAAIRDFIAGMTDRYAVRLYEHLFVPRPWVSVNARPRDGREP